MMVNKLGQGDCGSVCKGDENYDATMNQASIENNYNNLLLFQLYRQPHLQAASEASPRAKEASHFQFPLLFSPACNVTEAPLGDITNLSANKLRRKPHRERYTTLAADEKAAV
ncbi:hypothetical protein E2562_022409 [Oryza meyeriana var. granulata]|uniref:Uncharacterized protein n=1 Tax=Oryza meyeriana var. granulata TaxID=110450 RepID=A0A6G1EY68_9ORYZ|nr:hypothetical protein E2562_022409 [Oryza meyeriana var. granulata]